MGLRDLSQTRLRAWSAIGIWTLAGLGFVVTFFAGGGAEEFDTDSLRHFAGAVALAFGFLGYWSVLWLTRAPSDGPVPADERDALVVARAAQSTLVVTLVAVFALSLGLWTVFEAEGEVPVGWMWFLAYGSVILASLVFAAATLVADGRSVGRG
jgi:hypothetical protein